MLPDFVAWLISASLLLQVHGWYSSSCCGGEDCRPVPCDQLVEDRDGRWLYLPTRNIFRREQVHPSQDRHCHVCLGKVDNRSICLYIQNGA